RRSSRRSDGDRSFEGDDPDREAEPVLGVHLQRHRDTDRGRSALSAVRLAAVAGDRQCGDEYVEGLGRGGPPAAQRIQGGKGVVMDTTEIIVLMGGVGLIGLVLWYFFGEREGVEASVNAGGVQEVDVTVKGGYSPDTIVVRRGVPVRLNFYRDETSSCSE